MVVTQISQSDSLNDPAGSNRKFLDGDHVDEYRSLLVRTHLARRDLMPFLAAALMFYWNLC